MFPPSSQAPGILSILKLVALMREQYHLTVALLCISCIPQKYSNFVLNFSLIIKKGSYS